MIVDAIRKKCYEKPMIFRFLWEHSVSNPDRWHYPEERANGSAAPLRSGLPPPEMPQILPDLPPLLGQQSCYQREKPGYQEPGVG